MRGRTVLSWHSTQHDGLRHASFLSLAQGVSYGHLGRIALGMAAALLANMVLPGKIAGAYLITRQPAGPGEITCCRTIQKGSL